MVANEDRVEALSQFCRRIELIRIRDCLLEEYIYAAEHRTSTLIIHSILRVEYETRWRACLRSWQESSISGQQSCLCAKPSRKGKSSEPVLQLHRGVFVNYVSSARQSKSGCKPRLRLTGEPQCLALYGCCRMRLEVCRMWVERCRRSACRSDDYAARAQDLEVVMMMFLLST